MTSMMTMSRLAMLTLLVSSVSAENMKVETTSGVVKGHEGKYETREFLGIPYAKAAEGPLRFRRPVPVDKSETEIDAAKFSESCPQDQSGGGRIDEKFYTVSGKVGLNCLSVNVWQPPKKDMPEEGLVPVFIFLHGGAYIRGGTSLPHYDMPLFVKTTKLVVVTFNYRLGAEGFTYVPGTDIKGNQGMWDQALALKWVHDNIKNFGGDPEQVTFMGQSAGSISVTMHLSSTVTRDYFKRAITESGSAIIPASIKTVKEVTDVSAQLAKVLGCSGTEPAEIVTCLENTTPEDLVKAQSSSTLPLGSFLPMMDGEFNAEAIAVSLATGHVKQTEVLASYTKDEFSIIMAEWYRSPLIPAATGVKSAKPELTKDQAVTFLTTMLGPLAAPVIDKYATLNPFAGKGAISNYYDILNFISGDLLFRCPMATWGFMYANNPNAKLYAAVFNHRPSISMYPEWYGVPHEYDLLEVFGYDYNKYTKAEQSLTTDLMTMWGHFARTGNPAGDSKDITWTPFTMGSQLDLDLTLPKETGQRYEMESKWAETVVRCNFINTLASGK